MAFDNSLSVKLEERTKKAYASREAAGKPEGISLFGKDLRLIPVMPAAFLNDLAALQTGDVSKGNLLEIVELCVEEVDRHVLRDIFKTKIVDVDFVNDFLEYVIEYYTARPTDGPSTSSTTGELMAPDSQPASTPVVLVNSQPITPVS